MLGVGWTEMLVIGVVALIVIGPRDLPVVMGRIGKFAGMIRRMGNEFQRELNKATGLDEVRNLRNSITAPLKQTTEEIRREFNAIGAGGTVKPSGVLKPADPEAQSVVDEIRAAAGMPAVPATPATPQPTGAVPVVPEAPAVPAAPAADGGVVPAPSVATPPKAPVKARRPAAAAPVPGAPVTTGELAPPAAPAAPKRSRKSTALSTEVAGTALARPEDVAEPAVAKPRRRAAKPAAGAQE